MESVQKQLVSFMPPRARRSRSCIVNSAAIRRDRVRRVVSDMMKRIFGGRDPCAAYAVYAEPMATSRNLRRDVGFCVVNEVIGVECIVCDPTLLAAGAN